MNSEKRCLGLTRNLRRCNRIGSWQFFCVEHARQPVVWVVFLVFTIGAGAASILSYFSSSSHREVQSIREQAPPLPEGKNPSLYNPAEQHIVDLSSELNALRTRYEKFLQPNEAAGVNRDARQLAERLIAVDDSNLSAPMDIFKYQCAAYAWAMVLGSESDPQAKLTSIRDVLDACEKARDLVNELQKPSPYIKGIQHTRDWLIKDDAIPRLKRLSAVALCARWQLKKNESDRIKVQQILRDVPYDYTLNERPERTMELKPCVL